MNSNEVYLLGTVTRLDSVYYISEWYIKVFMSVKRTSGNRDEIPVVIPQRFFKENKIWIGQKAKICGQIKYNHEYYVLAKTATFVETVIEDGNEVELMGFVFEMSTIRQTSSSKRTIMNFTLICYDEMMNYCRIHCIAWGSNAWYLQNSISLNSYLFIRGRLQSRKYVKKGEEKTMYQVSVNHIELMN